MAPVLVEHPGDLVHRHPLGRSLAQTPIHQPVKAVFLVSLAIAPELPLRSHVVRFIDSPPHGGRKPDNSCAT
jgi:hypothetical protein